MSLLDMLDGAAVGEQLYEDDMILYRLERSPHNPHLYINEHAIVLLLLPF